MLDEISLLRFENIFGSNPGQIPPGATILSATLTYKVSSDANAQGNPGNIYESLVTWLETVTWNTFGGDPGVNSDEYANLIGPAPATTAGTAYTVDVLASLQRWSANPATNFGWVIRPTGTDGVKVWSSEYTTSADRPKLTVEYISGPVTCYALTLSHIGNGADPTASPTNSTGCAAGQYVAGESIALTAVPDTGYQVTGWTGTNNDTSTATNNTLTMPAAARTASVTYALIPPPDLLCTDFEPYWEWQRPGRQPGQLDGLLGRAVCGWGEHYVDRFASYWLAGKQLDRYDQQHQHSLNQHGYHADCGPLGFSGLWRNPTVYRLDGLQ